MAAFDYSEMAAVAVQMVADFGRAVTLRRLNTVVPNPAEPWVPAADPRAGATTLEVKAVFAHPSSASEFGIDVRVEDWVRRAEQLAIITHPDDLSTFSELIDGADLWRVIRAQPIRPGEPRLLHVVGVAR